MAYLERDRNKRREMAAKMLTATRTQFSWNGRGAMRFRHRTDRHAPGGAWDGAADSNWSRQHSLSHIPHRCSRMDYRAGMVRASTQRPPFIYRYSPQLPAPIGPYPYMREPSLKSGSPKRLAQYLLHWL